MNLVKWFRKNKTKVMAVVVIVIMIGFIGGSALTYLLSPGRTLGRRAVAYFYDNRKITNYDLALARRELEILRMLRADDLLRSQDLRGVLLAELLFSEGRAQAPLFNQIRQLIRAKRYRISDKQISDIYKQISDIYRVLLPSNLIYWLLLKNEAQLAGIRIPNDNVGELLARAIPQFFNGQTYSQLMMQLVNRYGIPEAQILTTFGELLAVLQYARFVCSTEDVTSSQMMHMASWENETIDVEFVKFDAAVFAKTQDQPTEEEMLEHFNKYREFFAGDVSEENPYGFGYKLPDRVQLEYIAVKLDDISSTVTPPTNQEMEEYYQKHTSQFTESVPEDPNDPNSPSIERTRSYADVEAIISKQLLQDKINSRAEGILQQARTLTEADLQDVGPESISAEQLKQKVGDYETAAEELAKQYKIKVYAGQTGLLSPADIEADKYLRRLYILGQGHSPVRLTQIVFSIDQLQTGPPASPRPLDVQKPRIYENIGPMKDFLGEIMALVRVTKAEKASAPESIDSILDTRSLMLDDDRESSIEHPVSRTVKEKVAEDLKKLAAVRQGQIVGCAEEFIDLVAKNGWENALNKFNELYGQQSKQDETDPNVFRLERLTDLRRISNKTLATLTAQSEDNPGQPLFVQEVQKWLSVNEAKIESQFIDQLYSLVPPDSNTVDSLPLALEFKPDMSFYVIKDISVKRLGQEQYEKIKARRVFAEEQIQSQTMAPVHFDPENILKRMNFRLAKKDEQETTKSEEAS